MPGSLPRFLLSTSPSNIRHYYHHREARTSINTHYHFCYPNLTSNHTDMMPSAESPARRSRRFNLNNPSPLVSRSTRQLPSSSPDSTPRSSSTAGFYKNVAEFLEGNLKTTSPTPGSQVGFCSWKISTPKSTDPTDSAVHISRRFHTSRHSALSPRILRSRTNRSFASPTFDGSAVRRLNNIPWHPLGFRDLSTHSVSGVPRLYTASHYNADFFIQGGYQRRFNKVVRERAEKTRLANFAKLGSRDRRLLNRNATLRFAFESARSRESSPIGTPSPSPLTDRVAGLRHVDHE